MLYNMSRSLRGVVIFAVYVCKASVYRLYTDKIREWRDQKDENTKKVPRCIGPEMRGSDPDGRARSIKAPNDDEGLHHQAHQAMSRNDGTTPKIIPTFNDIENLALSESTNPNWSLSRDEPVQVHTTEC